MNRCLSITFLLVLVCSSILATDWSQFEGSDIYPLPDKTNCVFPFTYQGNSYTDCTTDGDNGDIPWCSLTADYQGLIRYCYAFQNTTLQCLSSFTMPGGKTYTQCDYLSTSAKYKQCKTNHPTIKYRYCTDALSNKTKPSAGRRTDCDSVYTSLSKDHTMCFRPSPYATVVNLTDTEKQDLLDIHNSYRREVTSKYMFKLYWNDELAKMAQAHTNLCAFEHDLAANRLIPKYGWKNGQNIVMSSEIRSTPASLIDMMLSSEKENFHYGSNCSPGDNTCLHYTQAMISNITHVGCAQTHCVYPDRIERFVTCNYILSQYEDNYQTPYLPSDTAASACPNKQDDGLCDCGDVICKYSAGEYLDPSTCTCKTNKGKRSVRGTDEKELELEAEKTAVLGIKTGNHPTVAKRSLELKKLRGKRSDELKKLRGKRSDELKKLRGGKRSVELKQLRGGKRSVELKQLRGKRFIPGRFKISKTN